MPFATATMSGGTSVRGYINANGDQDWYAVTLTAGQTYTFALSGFGVNRVRACKDWATPWRNALHSSGCVAIFPLRRNE